MQKQNKTLGSWQNYETPADELKNLKMRRIQSVQLHNSPRTLFLHVKTLEVTIGWEVRLMKSHLSDSEKQWNFFITEHGSMFSKPFIAHKFRSHHSNESYLLSVSLFLLTSFPVAVQEWHIWHNLQYILNCHITEGNVSVKSVVFLFLLSVYRVVRLTVRFIISLYHFCFLQPTVCSHSSALTSVFILTALCPSLGTTLFPWTQLDLLSWLNIWVCLTSIWTIIASAGEASHGLVL